MATEGRAEWADRLYREHSRLVYNFLLHALLNREDAEDAAVETFRRVYAGIHGYRGQSSEKVWVMTIASNVAKRAGAHLRDQEAHEVHPDPASETVDSSDAEAHVLARHTAERLLGLLSFEQRKAVWLRVCMEHTDAETAEILGVPIGTVKAWVWRGLAKMRALAQEEEGA